MAIRKSHYVRAAIRGINTRATSLRNDIQTIAIECSGHAFIHGDVTLFDDLFDALSGMNRKLFVKWVTKYGFATIDGETGKFKLNKTMRKNTDFGGNDPYQDCIDWLTANASKWWAKEETAKQIAKDQDVAELLAALLRKMDKTEADGATVKNADEHKTAELIHLVTERARRAAA
jgi:hypothetical protein